MTALSPGSYLKCQSSGDSHSICLLHLSSVFLFLLSLLSRQPLISFPTPPFSSVRTLPEASAPGADTPSGLRSRCGHSQRPLLPVRDMSSGTRVVLFYASYKIRHRKTLNTVTPLIFVVTLQSTIGNSVSRFLRQSSPTHRGIPNLAGTRSFHEDQQMRAVQGDTEDFLHA